MERLRLPSELGAVVMMGFLASHETASRTMKKVVGLAVVGLTLAAAAVALIVGSFAGPRATLIAQEPGRAQTSTFMRLKLEPTKQILEGLALADFEMIASNAGKIRNLMLDEGWMVVQTDEYRRQSDEFRKMVEQVRDAANKKNLDAATLGYVQMTIRCVSCHELLRK
jgi:hypothetical protein